MWWFFLSLSQGDAATVQLLVTLAQTASEPFSISRIAATALHHGLLLMTYNRQDYDDIHDLKLYL